MQHSQLGLIVPPVGPIATLIGKGVGIGSALFKGFGGAGASIRDAHIQFQNATVEDMASEMVDFRTRSQSGNLTNEWVRLKQARIQQLVDDFAKIAKTPRAKRGLAELQALGNELKAEMERDISVAGRVPSGTQLPGYAGIGGGALLLGAGVLALLLTRRRRR